MSNCDCSGGSGVITYYRCDSNCPNGSAYVHITQKIIQRQVRVPSSLVAMNLGAFNVRGGTANKPLGTFANVNQSQASDRARFGIQTRYVPSRGNSTIGSVTRNRPGSLGPAGAGVDVKHNSYARYLARKKAPNLKTQSNPVALAIEGNKTRKWGLLNTASCACAS